MIPLDTVLTRVVTQRAQAGVVPYKGVVQTFSRILKEEGLRSMYSALPLKLFSVVPAIGIQVSARFEMFFYLFIFYVVVVFCVWGGVCDSFVCVEPLSTVFQLCVLSCCFDRS